MASCRWRELLSELTRELEQQSLKSRGCVCSYRLVPAIASWTCPRSVGQLMLFTDVSLQQPAVVRSSYGQVQTEAT